MVTDFSSENVLKSGDSLFCPVCRKAPGVVGSDCFPFCSQRCRLVDLGRWLDGSYASSRPLDPSEDDPLDTD
ncbi:MAG: DNA gyrase inhibitor YacG [Phycisphaerales bacterium]|nr:DNA gyrase inhibitor YacG [Phycisphaerales bacterium]